MRAHSEGGVPARGRGGGRGRRGHVDVSANERAAPGRGQVDWGRTFAALKEIDYDGWVVIEAFGDSLPELAGATKICARPFSGARTKASSRPSGENFGEPSLEPRVIRRRSPSGRETLHNWPT